MRVPQQTLRQEQIVPMLRRMLLRLEEMEQAEQFSADARHLMKAQIEGWLESVDTTQALPELSLRDTATLIAIERDLGSNREVFRIKGRIVRLPKTLAKLARALAVPSPGKWKTAKDLSVQLGNIGNNAKCGKYHAITQAVYRLRKELRRAGLNGRLIESRRGYGWRWRDPDKG